MTAILSGSLRHFPVETLVRFLSDRQNTGRLRLTGDSLHAEIYFEGGSIVAARHLDGNSRTAKDATGEDVLVDLLLWVGGAFELYEDIEKPQDLTIATVDLDSAVATARDKREKLAAAGAPLGWDALLDAGESDGANVTLTAKEFRLVMRVKEPRTVEQLSADSDDRDATRLLLQSLVERGILRAVPAGRTSLTPSSATEMVPTTVGPEVTTNRPGAEAPSASPQVAAAASDATEFPMSCLTVDDEARTPHPLLADEYTIGRDAGNSIHIDDHSVSSRHARLARTSAGFELEDLKSRNGTFVNGVRVEKVLLQDNDNVRIGKVFATYNTATQMDVQETFMGRITEK